MLSQFNNLGLLIFAYIVQDIYTSTNNQCKDRQSSQFLYWILYGSTIVYGFILILYSLMFTGILDKLLSICCCNTTFVTLNALGFLIIAVGFHILTIFYGIYQLHWQPESQCQQLRLFVRVCGNICTLWLIIGTAYFGYNYLCTRLIGQRQIIR